MIVLTTPIVIGVLVDVDDDFTESIGLEFKLADILTYLTILKVLKKILKLKYPLPNFALCELYCSLHLTVLAGSLIRNERAESG